MAQNAGRNYVPWFCVWCRKDNKGSHNNCGFCGAHWEECAAATQAGKSPRRKKQPSARRWAYSTEWDGDAEPWTTSTPRRAPPAQPSPRGKAAKSPARQQPKQKKTAKKMVPANEPDWTFNAEKLDQAAAPASSGGPSVEAQQLRELMTAVKQSDLELTPAIQAAMSKINPVITPKEASKMMHSAVSKLDHAREKLQKAKTARNNMHKNWNKFLADAVTRWQQHSEKFSKEDADLLTGIETATSAFQAARTHLEDTKQALAEFDNVIENDIQEVSDEELMVDALPGASAGIQEMLNSLQRLQEVQADTVESASKKQRTEETPEDGKASGLSVPPSMRPFGRGGP